MIRLIKATTAAQRTIKARVRREIPIIHKMIKKACKNGEDFITIPADCFSEASEQVLLKSGYTVSSRISYHDENDTYCEGYNIFWDTSIAALLETRNLATNDIKSNN